MSKKYRYTVYIYIYIKKERNVLSFFLQKNETFLHFFVFCQKTKRAFHFLFIFSDILLKLGWLGWETTYKNVKRMFCSFAMNKKRNNGTLFFKKNLEERKQMKRMETIFRKVRMPNFTKVNFIMIQKFV